MNCTTCKEERTRQPIPRPTTCPVCAGGVGRKRNVSGTESAILFCLNEDCPAKAIGKIDRYIRSLDILGLGDGVLQTLVDEKRVLDPADLYLIRPETISDMKISGKVRLGDKRAQKIVDAIHGKKNLTLPQFLGSLGIEGLGKRRVALIQAAVPGEMDLLDDWLSEKLLQIKDRASVPNTASRICEGVQGRKKLIEKLLGPAGVQITAAAPAPIVAPGAKSFCITGKTELKRAVLQDMIRSAGHIVKDDVSAGLTYLVMASVDSTSSKAKKAEKLGTTCISEAQLLEILKS